MIIKTYKRNILSNTTIPMVNRENIVIIDRKFLFDRKFFIFTVNIKHMFVANIFGYPKVCCNTNCKHPFNKGSHLGWLPRNDMDIYTIMICPRCKSKFKIIQEISLGMVYYDKLPNLTKDDIKSTQITEKEMITIQNISLNNSNIFEDLNNGMVPGLSNTMRPVEKNDKI